MTERQKVAFTGNAIEHFFQFRFDDVNAYATVLAGSVVMMGREYFTQFNLAFKSMPDAVNNAEPFKESDGPVGSGPINCRCASFGQSRGGGRPLAEELLKNSFAWEGIATARIFQNFFEAIDHSVSISIMQ